MAISFSPLMRRSLSVVFLFLAVLGVSGMALRPAWAQTALLNEQFNGVDGASLDAGQWTYFDETHALHRTQFGNRPFIKTEGADAFARLKLDTYNDNTYFADPHFKGTELISKNEFRLGSGLEIEARVRGNNLPPGIVFAFFTYGERGVFPTSYSKEEIDFEFLSKRTRDSLWLNIWNDHNARYPYNDGFHNKDSQPPPTVSGLDWSGWNTYKIRWLNNKVEWLVRNDATGVETLVRTETAVLPDDAMNVHFNIWAPESSWGAAYDASLQPVTDPSANTSYYVDVDYVKVTSLPPPARAVVGNGLGLTGTYFNNTDLIGATLERLDSRIYFNWLNFFPDPALNADNFSARWTGQVQAQYSENYTFYARANDGVRVWVNDQQIINGWNQQAGAVEYSGTISMVAGQKYSIRVEYKENIGNAEVQLRWSSPSTPKQAVPQSQLYPMLVAAPTFSPNGGTYQNGANVVVSSTTPGAIIHYTTDGREPTIDDPSVLSGDTVAVRASGTLKANAWRSGWQTSATSSAVFTIVDTIAPSVSITNPVAGYSYLSLETATGTARDTGGSGLQQINGRLFRQSDRTYWNGTGWTPGEAEFAAQGTSSWTLNLPPLTDSRYTLRARAVDGAGNSGVSDELEFIIDTTAPVVRVANIADERAYKSVAEANGTAQDVGPGVAELSAQLFRYSDGFFWNGTSWAATQATLTPQGTDNWTVPFPTLADGRYAFRVSARDYGGNVSTPLSIDFVIDNVAPGITVSAPTGTTYTLITGARGTATDDRAGVREVRTRLWRSGDGYYWNGTAWTATKVELLARGTATWTLAFPPLTNNTYYFLARAVDQAGNYTYAPAVSFIVKAVPIIKVTTPVNNANYSSIAGAAGTVVDNNAGVRQVRARLWRDGDNFYWNGSTWTATKTELPANGIENWTWPFPPLAANRYHFLVRALDRGGVSTYTPIINFTVGASGTAASTAPAASMAPAPPAFSSGIARVASNSIELNFTAALNAASLDPANFALTINGVVVGIESASYNAASNTVVLVPQATLALDASAVVSWTGLRSASNQSVADGSWRGTAR